MTNSAKQYIETCRDLMKDNPHALAYYDRYLKFGRCYSLSSLSQEQWEFFKSLRGNMKMKIKQCYKNCQRIALEDTTGRVKYIEGVATSVIPVPHAWLLIDGKVFDPTWKRFDKSEHKREYFGIEVPKEMILRNQVSTGAYCSVLDNLLLVLKDGLSEESLVAPPDSHGTTSVVGASPHNDGLDAGNSAGSVDPFPAAG